MTLYRPVGRAELDLIAESNFTAFPPRLPQQPIFYPVLTQKYAEEIASKWNTQDKDSQFSGYVVQFEVEDDYISQFQAQTVGKSYHKEYWIPDTELENFNRHILSEIEVIRRFE